MKLVLRKSVFMMSRYALYVFFLQMLLLNLVPAMDISLKNFPHSSVDITVRGQVVDEAGDPLPGATVTVEGTTRGTITDLEGNYSITVPEDAILVFSYIGYEARRVPVDNRSQIDVTLNTDMSSLEEGQNSGW